MKWSAAQTLSWIIRREPLELKQWTSDMGPKITDAQRGLTEKLAAGVVQAWGRKQPHGLTEQLPSDPFRITGITVTVGVHGDMVTLPVRPHQPFNSYEGPRWQSIEFEENQVKLKWPKLPPPSATEWMLREAKALLETTRQLGKRGDMVRRCMKETTCTKRAAEAAHKMLPDKLKRNVGNKGNSRL